LAAGDEVGVDEGRGYAHDHVGEVVDLKRWIQASGVDLFGDQVADEPGHAALVVRAGRGEHPQRDLGLALQERSHERRGQDVAQESLDYCGDALASARARLLVGTAYGQLGERPEDFA
jgi:hypothetical protein